jgi:putative toxin-antitoxin system antitoxin component (TIGR02293 family)
MIAAEKVTETLGGERVLRAPVRCLNELERLVHSRLPFAALQALIAAGGLSPAEVKAHLVPASTYARRARGALSATESERTEYLARVIATTEEVFLDRGKAHRWLRATHPELAGRTPLETAAGEFGARRVEALLWEIAHGIPA